MELNSKIGYRDFLVSELKKEFLGPGSEEKDNNDIDYERISESPLKRYFTGILYPQKAYVGDSDLDPTETETEIEPTSENESITIFSEEEKSFDSESTDTPIIPENFKDQTITYANQYCPSSYGLSFFIKGDKNITLTINAARYERLNKDEIFIVLQPDELFIKNLPHKNSFRLDGNKFFFLGMIDKNHRNEIRNYCKDLYLNSLDKNESDHIKQLLALNKYNELETQIKEGLNRHYLVFSRIYDKSRNFKSRGFRRMPCKTFFEKINLEEESTEIIKDWPQEKLKVIIKNRQTGNNDIKKVTVSVINFNKISEQYSKYTNPELSYFQNHISVSINPAQTHFVELSKLRIGYTAEEVDYRLYSSKKIFAAGHGCSANWEGNEPELVYSEFLPQYEVPRVNPEPEKIKDLRLNIFNMQKLAYNDLLDTETLVKELNIFANEYHRWIDISKENISDEDKQVLQVNEEQCYKIATRIKNGINLLASNRNVLLAFRLANESMLIQRSNTEKYFRNNIHLSELYNNHLAYKQLSEKVGIWRPFQLAFILLCLESIVNPKSEERSIADLLWFPTGGGKTEAYLGVIAFTIFYRRLTFKNSGGTAVIMRYTLRLLTAQQFQRAATLICGCEFLRNKYHDLGKEPISIGLWVGKENTPNTNKDAIKYVNKLGDQHTLEFFKTENPFQLTHCPWCSTPLLNDNNPILSGYVSHPKFHFQCINDRCFFNSKLPIQVVDELIYENPPSLLFATVDKFARLAWDSKTKALFGFSEKEGKTVRIYRPPDLILQDELHLISGPLGSMFGIYEAVIDYLCSESNVFPKIICSTATIKKADEQIKSLFNRTTCIFPQNYHKIEDSFFAEEIPLEKERGRLYLGIMSVGQTQQSAQIKIFYTLLYYNYINSASDNIIDTYSTIVSYFNTINELGVATSLINDDVKEKIKMLQDRRRDIISRPIWYRELTSRMKSKELPIILNELEKNIFSRDNGNNSIPVLLTTNMFSVGIDISRLNLMFMNSQPKSNSEYIQSTSRVGRKDPGLVTILFDGFRPRDKSHYENFRAFHSSYYRFVEPTGVTPFSLQARARVLHTVLVIVARLLYGLPENKDAANFNHETIDNDFLKYFIKRIAEIDPSEVDESNKKLQMLIEEWKSKTTDLVYSIMLSPQTPQYIVNAMLKSIPLMRDISAIRDEREKKAWPVMQSLRNVDIPTVCKMRE